MCEEAHEEFMREALRQAELARDADEVPVGCVVVHEGRIIGRGHNMREATQDPTAHAELIALREAASKLGTWRLHGATVYCTLEPCAMCAGALMAAQVESLVFALADEKSGACGSVCNVCEQEAFNHSVEVRGGVLEEESHRLLRGFFIERR